MSTRIKAFRYVWNRHEILVGKYLKTKIRRSLTKHFTETFPLIHLYPFRTIIDSNRHKSLLNRWLNSHHPVHCLLLRIKFLCPPRNGWAQEPIRFISPCVPPPFIRNKDYVFDQLLRPWTHAARIRCAVNSPKRLSRIRDLLRPRS